jgi:hypothetical protein
MRAKQQTKTNLAVSHGRAETAHGISRGGETGFACLNNRVRAQWADDIGPSGRLSRGAGRLRGAAEDSMGVWQGG